MKRHILQLAITNPAACDPTDLAAAKTEALFLECLIRHHKSDKDNNYWNYKSCGVEEVLREAFGYTDEMIAEITDAAIEQVNAAR